MKKLELSYEMERALGKNRNTVLALWYKIAYYQEKHGYCDKTNPELAKALKVSLSTIERAIRKLINLGLVLKVKAHFWSRTLFAVRPTLARENLLENCSRGTECEATTDGTTDGTSDGIYINNKKVHLNIRI